ncbi:MAG: hypothetical protein ACSW8B_02285, partial [bacterium]
MVARLLPFRFMILLVALLLFIDIGLYMMQKPIIKINRYGRKIRHETKKGIATKFIQLLLCVCLCYGCYAVSSASGFISSISGAKHNAIEYSVITLADSGLKSVEDLNEKTIGHLKLDDATEVSRLNQVLTKVMNDMAPGEYQPKTYSTIAKQVDALYDQKVDAIVIKEVERVSYKQQKKDFKKETKVIASYDVKIPAAKANTA